MKPKFVITSLLTAALALGATATMQKPSEAGSTRFVCGMSSTTGLPTTYAMTQRGPVPVVRWYSEYFTAAGYTPERRCQIVSAKFDNFNRQGQLNFITAGYVNGQPVVCAGSGGGCNSSNMLFTLKSGADAASAVQQLFDLRSGRAAGPLYESSADDGGITIDMNNYLSNAAVDPNGPSMGSQGTTASPEEPTQPPAGGSVW